MKEQLRGRNEIHGFEERFGDTSFSASENLCVVSLCSARMAVETWSGSSYHRDGSVRGEGAEVEGRVEGGMEGEGGYGSVREEEGG